MEQESSSLHEIVAVWKRRRWLFALPAAVTFVVAVIVALVVPSIYRSSAVILIEKPDVPPDLVASTITGYADERIQIIQRKVTATDNLVEIIEKFDLYAEKRKSKPLHAIAERMREKITLELLSAEVTEERAGRNTEAVIAFSVAFDHPDPVVAQRVANELVSLYLSENVRFRQKRATETAEFLGGESERLERRIAELEKKLADLKQKYTGRLPEQLDYNLKLVDIAEGELRRLDERENALVSRRIYLQAELMKISPYGSYVVDGQHILSPQDQLKALRTMLASLSGRYGPNHPDVQRIKREVAALEQSTRSGPSASSLRREVERVETELAKAKEKYSEDHPDIARLTRQLAQLRSEQTSAREAPASAPRESPDNPAYISIQSQLQAAQAELSAIAEQRAAVREKLAEYEDRIMQTPIVEREYLQLSRAHESALESYREIKEKQMQAQLGETLETERKSERFTLLEPPLLPDKPHWPDRRLFILLGFLLSLGVGAGTASLAEALDTSVYGARQVAAIVGAAPLVTVPYIRTRVEQMHAIGRRIAFATVFVGVVAGTLAYVHYSVTPLDVLWAGVEHRVVGEDDARTD
jgi:uncharacterized protein involved in exopolysaccharide biosynthesis